MGVNFKYLFLFLVALWVVVFINSVKYHEKAGLFFSMNGTEKELVIYTKELTDHLSKA